MELNQSEQHPLFDTTSDQTPAPGNETLQKGKLGRKQIFLLLGGFVFLLGVAIFGFMGGFIQSDSPTESSIPNDAGASSLAPPEARPHGLDYREKYDKYGFDGASLSPTTSGAMDRQAAAGTQLLTGKDPSALRGSNESLSESDLQVMSRKNGPTTAPYQTATERKTLRQRQLNRQFGHQQAEREAIYRTMHRSPKGKEQVAEERIARRERDLDRQTADALLKQMETANQRFAGTSAGGQGAASGTSLNMNEYQQLKQLHNGELPPSYRAYFKREIEAENGAKTGERDASVANPLSDEADLPARKAINLSNVGFYGLSSQTRTDPVPKAGSGQSIPAVIHGDGEAITVQQGSSVKIRLLNETPLRVADKWVTLPAHTLLTGTCSIGQDRLNITVTSLRIGSEIYPIGLNVFDLDGRAGLSVPNLSQKNQLAQGAARSASQAVSSPYYFVPQGSFGQQVGSQVAMQVTNTAFQGIRSLLQTKLNAVKVTVKPNYRVFLRPEGANSMATE